MNFIYNILIGIASYVIKGLALFNPKMKLFVQGRKNIFDGLATKIPENKKKIWIHCASLGEFEQGRPIIEALFQNEDHYIVLSFFSPSGYEVRKNYDCAHHIMYLPLDTKKNAQRFIDVIQPDLAIFVKYEFWPNYLFQLSKKQIKTILISGIFRPKQTFFKAYGGWMRKALHTFEHFFVQDVTSKELLQSINKTNVTISGDTRFDRVYDILQQDNSLTFMDEFKAHHTCVIYGSTWKEDHEVIADFINQTDQKIKHVIAPHHIDEDTVQNIKPHLKGKRIALFSEIDQIDLNEFDVLIVNTIGILTKIYSYADIAYVGGAFKTGLHNTLEPAVFGTPIIIGPEYQKFNEAKELVKLGGILVVHHKKEALESFNMLVEDHNTSRKIGAINSDFIIQNKGATAMVIDYLSL